MVPLMGPRTTTGICTEIGSHDPRRYLGVAGLGRETGSSPRPRQGPAPETPESEPALRHHVFFFSAKSSAACTAPAATTAQGYIRALLAKVDPGDYLLAHISPQQFRRAWEMRQKYHDKPDISFVDFTSMITMQDLGITEVFTGDAHFQQVGLGLHLVP